MNSFEQPGEPSPAGIAKKAFGFVLIIIGVGIGLWIVSVIYDLLVNARQIQLIHVITQELDRTVRSPSGELELPAGIFVAGGYLLACVLLSICAGIAKAFLSFGVRLVQSDTRRMVSQLADELKSALKASRTSTRSTASEQLPPVEPR